MSRTVAVICEMNPLHLGHEKILDEARRLAGTGCVAAVMSGNFVQRAAPAVFDRYVRAETLLQAGVDLVVELPFPWCAGGAAYFARAGVAVASSVCADALVFGSECGDVKRLAEASAILSCDEFLTQVQNLARRGMGEAAAREKAAGEINEAFAEIVRSPNDTLALAYIDECRKRRIDYFCICRSRTPVFSATEIRRTMALSVDHAWISLCSAHAKDVYRRAVQARLGPVKESEYVSLLHSILAVAGDRLPAAAEGGGGIRERLLRVARSSADGESYFSAVATKKYTNARLRRAALFLACGVPSALLSSLPAYTILLGANEKGQAHLRRLSRLDVQDRIPIVTKPSSARRISQAAERQAELSDRADAFFTRLLPERTAPNCYLKHHPVLLP